MNKTETALPLPCGRRTDHCVTVVRIDSLQTQSANNKVSLLLASGLWGFDEMHRAFKMPAIFLHFLHINFPWQLLGALTFQLVTAEIMLLSKKARQQTSFFTAVQKGHFFASKALLQMASRYVRISSKRPANIATLTFQLDLFWFRLLFSF